MDELLKMVADRTTTPIDYKKAREVIEGLFSVVEDNFREGQVPKVPESFVVATNVLFLSNTQSFREVALGCGLVRYLDKEADLRLPYASQGPTSYNGRTLDERVINPFFQDRQIPSSKGPYLATFRRSVRFDESTRDGVRDKAGYDAFLVVLEHFEATSDDSEIAELIRSLLYGFVRLRDASRVALAHINRLNLDQYDTLLEALLKTPSGGLLPVLLTVAMFQTIKECFSLGWEIDWQGINVADKATGVGGDVSISENGILICAIEVTERPISRSRVVSTFNTKISPNGIGDYMFVFTGINPDPDARQVASQYFGQGHDVNFIDIKPWLLNNLATIGSACRSKFTKAFLSLMDTSEVPAALKVKWNDLVKRLFG